MDGVIILTWQEGVRGNKPGRKTGNSGGFSEKEAPPAGELLGGGERGAAGHFYSGVCGERDSLWRKGKNETAENYGSSRFILGKGEKKKWQKMQRIYARWGVYLQTGSNSCHSGNCNLRWESLYFVYVTEITVERRIMTVG